MVSRQVNAERVVLLGWSRAILLQIAHPLVAAGVAEHSSFRGGAIATAVRLRHTVRAMLRLAFGDAATAERTIAGIRAIHRRVHGHLREPVGRFPAGHPYSAEDPALLLWVHATLIESVILVYDLLVGPITAADRDRYCEESAAVAVALGARDDEVPKSWPALVDYMERQRSAGALAVGSDARVLADAILHPPFRVLTGPLGWINRLMTVGLLPDTLRAQYGWSWSSRQAWQLRIVVRLLRTVRRLLPFGWAHWPEARGLPTPAAPHAVPGNPERLPSR
jgi:uncharacterized protein (DUF2236 family)